jgi:hypothetical protein
VTVSTAAGSVFSRAAKVETIHLPRITNQIPELDLRVPQDSNVTLTVELDRRHLGHPFYTWHKDGEWLPLTLSAPSYRPFTSRVTDEGDYGVVVSNEAGSVTSAVWHVTLTLRGEASAWGDNTYGQLDSDRAETNLVAVAAGGLHSLGLREDGTVVAWGYNGSGQTSVPSGLSNVVALAAGNAHSLALRDDGTVAAWGANNYGQTQMPTAATNLVAVAAGSYHNLGLRRDGTVLGWGETNFGALEIPADVSNVVAVAAGDALSYALLSNGTVRTWGSGGFGAVTVPANLTNVVQLAAGYTHALALKADGTVVGLAQDSGWGETVPPAGLSNLLQVSAGYMFSAVLQNDGTVRAWGRDDYGQTAVPSGLGDTKQVAAGGWHCLALAYSPILNYPVNVSKDLLLICNTNSSDSTNLLNYYLAHRPMVGNANVLRVGTDVGEHFQATNHFTNQLLGPLLQWHTNHPTKRPAYVVMFLDIPTYGLAPGNGASISRLIREALPQRPPFVTYLNMGGATGQSTALADCMAYIDKLTYFGTNYPDRMVISASLGGYANTNYFLDDENRYYGNHGGVPTAGGIVVRHYDAMLAAGMNSNVIDFISTTSATQRFGTNVAGYMSWGAYGWGSDYVLNGAVTFNGSSAWYILNTAESYNGRKNYAGLGDYAEWFSPNAFGGTNYEGTPVGAVCYTDEPDAAKVNEGGIYFDFWNRGRYFAICAWLSKESVQRHLLVVGDPLVKR